MKVLLFVLLTFFYTSAQPDWYPSEEYHPHWHVGLSTASQLTAYYTFNTLLEIEHDRALLYSITGGLIPGILKEMFDKRTSNDFNMKDMGYNTMGVTLGVSMVLMYRLNF
jgi:hypothetical protein